MTFKRNNIVHIEAEPDRVCQLCSKKAETRPYGPGGKRVCFECAMLNKPEAERRFKALIEGDNTEPDTTH